MSELQVLLTEKTLTVSQDGGPTHTFEIVQEIPLGYSIWHIGSDYMPDGYLPLCRLAAHQPFPGGRNIETDTLKAIKIDCSKKIMDAISGCEGTVKSMEEYASCNKNAKSSTWSYRQAQRIEEVLPVLKRISACH